MIAFVEEAQAETVAKLGPLKPYLIENDHMQYPYHFWYKERIEFWSTITSGIIQHFYLKVSKPPFGSPYNSSSVFIKFSKLKLHHLLLLQPKPWHIERNGPFFCFFSVQEIFSIKVFNSQAI
jgi:hypothetical protein